MGYNRFKWWTRKKKNKPLPEYYPLAEKIKNGDYDYSYMFGEANEVRESAKKAYQQTYDNYGGTDEKNRIEVSLDASRMKRLRALKLELEAHKDEQMILWKLRRDLEKTFGVDLWEEALEKMEGFELIDIYQYYKSYASSN